MQTYGLHYKNISSLQHSIVVVIKCSFMFMFATLWTNLLQKCRTCSRLMSELCIKGKCKNQSILQAWIERIVTSKFKSQDLKKSFILIIMRFCCHGCVLSVHVTWRQQLPLSSVPTGLEKIFHLITSQSYKANYCSKCYFLFLFLPLPFANGMEVHIIFCQYELLLCFQQSGEPAYLGQWMLRLLQT